MKLLTTEVVILVVILLLVAWEVWTFKNKRPRDTISEVTWRAVYRQPIIAFLGGLLAGHLFWQSARCREILMEEELREIQERRLRNESRNEEEPVAGLARSAVPRRREVRYRRSSLYRGEWADDLPRVSISNTFIFPEPLPEFKPFPYAYADPWFFTYAYTNRNPFTLPHRYPYTDASTDAIIESLRVPRPIREQLR